jgi:hypothetical protein
VARSEARGSGGDHWDETDDPQQTLEKAWLALGILGPKASATAQQSVHDVVSMRVFTRCSEEASGNQDVSYIHKPQNRQVVLQITLEPVEKTISDSLFSPSMLKDRDQSSFCTISLGVCSFGRVSSL